MLTRLFILFLYFKLRSFSPLSLFYSTSIYIDTNSIFYYIHLNFLRYPTFYSFCIIYPFFPACPKNPIKFKNPIKSKNHWFGPFLKKTWVFLNPDWGTIQVSTCSEKETTTKHPTVLEYDSQINCTNLLMKWTLILANTGHSAHMQSVSCRAGSLCVVRQHQVHILLLTMVRRWSPRLLTMWMLLDYRSVRNGRQMTTGRSWSVITTADKLKLDIDNECTKSGLTVVTAR